jgi:hypothetical protein
MRNIMIFHALIALVVSVIILDGCDGGVNYKYLKTPESVVTSKKGQAEAPVFQFCYCYEPSCKRAFCSP